MVRCTSNIIRILAVMSVVLGHTADMPMFNPTGGVGSSDWWVANGINSLCRWAVPVFVMLSGAHWLSSPSSSNLREFYTHRFSRVGIPLLFWTIFYAWFAVAYTGWVTPTQALFNFLQGHPYPHLHFIAVITGLYLFTPMLSIFVHHASEKVLWTTVILCFVLAMGNSLTSVALNSPPNLFSRFVPFLGYYLIGYLLRDTRLSTRQCCVAALAALTLSIIIATSTGYFALKQGMKLYPSWPMAAYDFASPPRILHGILGWLILAHMLRKPLGLKQETERFISHWAGLTFGIYLIHPAIRDFLHAGIGHDTPLFHLLPRGMWFEGWQTSEPTIWIGLFIEFMVVYVASIALVFVIKRLPILNRII